MNNDITDLNIENIHYSNIALLSFFFFLIWGFYPDFTWRINVLRLHKSWKPWIRIHRGLQPPVTCGTRKHIPRSSGLPEGCGAGSSGGCVGARRTGPGSGEGGGRGSKPCAPAETQRKRSGGTRHAALGERPAQARDERLDSGPRTFVPWQECLQGGHLRLLKPEQRI